MKEYNCPDCPGMETCSNCPRVPSNFGSKSVSDYLDYIPAACRECSNHPINGGSGICNCTLGVAPIICYGG